MGSAFRVPTWTETQKGRPIATWPGTPVAAAESGDSRFQVRGIAKIHVLCAAVVFGIGLGWLWSSPARPAPSDLDTCFASPDVRRQFEDAAAHCVQAALPDPKGEFAAFLPKTAFLLRSEDKSARLVVLDNPNLAFLSKLVSSYNDPEVAEKLLKLCRQEEPERLRKLASYTVQRVLDRLGADNQDRRLSPEARRAMSRAVIEELAANTSIDSENQIRDVVADYLARSATTRQDVLAYGFSLVEYDEPTEKEWRAMQDDARPFCVRFFGRGFTIYRMRGEQRSAQDYTNAGWRERIEGALAGWQGRHGTSGKPWMGIGTEETEQNEP
jgi:hypothetical protein